jgi:hypothetical protein
MIDDQAFSDVDDLTAPPEAATVEQTNDPPSPGPGTSPRARASTAAGAELDSSQSSVPAGGREITAHPGMSHLPDPSPVIVIEYRRSLVARLVPPMLILVVALAVTVYPYQRLRPRAHRAARPADQPSEAKPTTSANPEGKVLARAVNREQMEASEAASKTPASTPAHKPKPETPPDLVLPPEPARVASAPQAASRPLEREPRSPFEVDLTTPARPTDPPPTTPPGPAENSPPGAAPIDPALAGPPDGAPPAENPPVSKEDILRDIQREADQVQADRNDREQLKPQARVRMLNDSLVRIESARLQFRNALREALKTYGNKAGPEIDRLCDEYGREVPEEIQERYVRAKRSFPQNLTRRAEIDRMRALGLPEPVLFDFLAHKIDKTMNSRKGPRNQFEVMVRAAQQLLSFPLPNPPRANPGPATGT